MELYVPPVTVLPVNVSADGSDSVGLPATPSPLVEVISFAVPVTVRCAYWPAPVRPSMPVEANPVMLSRQVPLLAVQLVPPDATASGTWQPQPLAVLLTSVAFAVVQKPTENRFGTSTSNGIASDGPDVGARRPTTVNAGSVCGNGTCAPASAATNAMKNASGTVSLRMVSGVRLGVIGNDRRVQDDVDQQFLFLGRPVASRELCDPCRIAHALFEKLSPRVDGAAMILCAIDRLIDLDIVQAGDPEVLDGRAKIPERNLPTDRRRRSMGINLSLNHEGGALRIGQNLSGHRSLGAGFSNGDP